MPPLHYKRKKFWKRVYTVLIHLSLWVTYTAVQLFATNAHWDNWTPVIINMIFLHAFSASIFYFNSEWLLPRTLEKGKKLLWFMGLLGLFGYLYIIRYLFLIYLFPIINGTKLEIPLLNYALNIVWWWFQPAGFSTGYWFAKATVKRERAISLQREAINRKQNEQMQLEVAYLRAQINPHFLFNTLGYFYNKTFEKQPDVADGIMSLTNIMRSSLKKRGPNDLIPLEEELEHIESLISIYRMRFNNSLHVSYKRPDNVAGYFILPHLLITLVENAFKHGDLHMPAHPLEMQLTLTENGLHFYIHDKKRIGPKELSNGIGMEYVQRQLNNAYKNEYSFEIIETDHFYTLTLHIKDKAKQANLFSFTGT